MSCKHSNRIHGKPIVLLIVEPADCRGRKIVLLRYDSPRRDCGLSGMYNGKQGRRSTACAAISTLNTFGSRARRFRLAQACNKLGTYPLLAHGKDTRCSPRLELLPAALGLCPLLARPPPSAQCSSLPQRQRRDKSRLSGKRDLPPATLLRRRAAAMQCPPTMTVALEVQPAPRQLYLAQLRAACSRGSRQPPELHTAWEVQPAPRQLSLPRPRTARSEGFHQPPAAHAISARGCRQKCPCRLHGSGRQRCP